MERKPGTILRAAEILAHRRSFSQRLNPNSLLRGTGLARRCGLERVGVSMAWLAPGKESFAYHAHRHEEEWLFVVSGWGVAIVDETEHEIGRASCRERV